MIGRFESSLKSDWLLLQSICVAVWHLMLTSCLSLWQAHPKSDLSLRFTGKRHFCIQNTEQIHIHTEKHKPGVAFDLFSGRKRTAVRSKGFFFTPLLFFRISRAQRGSLYAPTGGVSSLTGLNRYRKQHNTEIRSKWHEEAFTFTTLFTKRLFKYRALVRSEMCIQVNKV